MRVLFKRQFFLYSFFGQQKEVSYSTFPFVFSFQLSYTEDQVVSFLFSEVVTQQSRRLAIKHQCATKKIFPYFCEATDHV
jgi:hypothetical protein